MVPKFKSRIARNLFDKILKNMYQGIAIKVAWGRYYVKQGVLMNSDTTFYRQLIISRRKG